ncbi:hypothetical protein Goshw_014230 [Gossypium schwendimanii]|uniref:DUF7745 domain-containing protein n=1 Tax=Gossypium schwendimanii TaxID=34291 RepID=A0A7J9NET8_GOSSC|nr:hypothetical protein [Gossypium schwendimanii]
MSINKFVATPRRDDVSEEKWMTILQNLQDHDVKWRAPWLIPDEILYRCGDLDWVPLLGIWEAIRRTITRKRFKKCLMHGTELVE